MTAKEYLKQAGLLDTRINSKIEQVSSLHDLATKAVTTLSDMPGSPNRNTHKMENIIVKILMLENEINSDIDKLVDLKNEILHVINAIPEEECRVVLEKRYLGRETFEQIASELGYGLDNIYRIHGKALTFVKVPETIQ